MFEPQPHNQRPILAVDSDGTVFDAMTPKHHECFTPALLDVFGLRGDAVTCEIARELFLQINLRSPARGANRFDALALFWREFRSRIGGAQWERLKPARLDVFLEWAGTSSTRNEARLSDAIAREKSAPADALALALDYSREVNRRCTLMPPPLPFANAPETLRDAAKTCDIVIVSGGNGAIIREEWTRAGLIGLASDLRAQEAGTKTEILRMLAAKAGTAQRVLMVGDAPQDADAANVAGTLFFPIIPDDESTSWGELRREIIPAFVSGNYTAAEAKRKAALFTAMLAATPSFSTTPHTRIP